MLTAGDGFAGLLLPLYLISLGLTLFQVGVIATGTLFGIGILTLRPLFWGLIASMWIGNLIVGQPYLRMCAMCGVEPVPRERALRLN